MDQRNNRVLIADGDNNLANRMSAYLKESGFAPKVISNSYLLQKTLLEWRPKFLFIDLLVPGAYAQQILKFLGERQMLGEDGCHVIVMSKHNAELNVRNCLESGAEDFVVKPFKMIDILERLALLSQVKRYNFNGLTNNNERQIKNYFEMIRLLVEATNQDKDISPMRFEISKMISIALKAVRTSIIATNHARDEIEVIRSSDDESLTKLPLDLKKYPEVQYVLRTEKSLFIESLEKDLTMAFVKHEVKTINFDSMMVLPLIQGGILRGCMSIRMPKDCKKLTYYDIKMAEIAAQLLSSTWKFQEVEALKKAG